MLPQRFQPALHQFLSRIGTPKHPRLSLLSLAQAQSSNAHRIQMDRAGHLHRLVLLLDQDRLEPPLENGPPATMRPIELDRISHIEPADPWLRLASPVRTRK